jgi:hypothetical protein
MKLGFKPSRAVHSISQHGAASRATIHKVRLASAPFKVTPVVPDIQITEPPQFQPEPQCEPTSAPIEARPTVEPEEKSVEAVQPVEPSRKRSRRHQTSELPGE